MFRAWEEGSLLFFVSAEDALMKRGLPSAEASDIPKWG